MTQINRYKQYFFLALVSALLYLPFLGHVHLFDWDEINFAEIAREMLVTGNYFKVQINFESFHEKPPLFAWLQVLSMKLLGMSEYAARFPNALCGIATTLSLCWMGSRIRSTAFGVFWAIAYMGSVLPSFYFRSGLIDPVYNLLALWALYFLAIGTFRRTWRSYVWAGIFLGLASLTKGPAIPGIVGLTWVVYESNTTPRTEVFSFWLSLLKHIRLRIINLFVYFLLCILPTLIFLLVWIGLQDDGTVLQNLQYHLRLLQTADAGHKGPFYYHFVVLLFGCFPASVLALSAVAYIKKRPENNSVESKNFYQVFSFWMFTLLILVLTVFTIVQTKILHYSSLAYFPITFFAAVVLERLHNSQVILSIKSRLGMLAIGFVLGIAFLILPLAGMYKHLWIQYLNDPFARDCLQTDVRWRLTDLSIGIFFLASLIFTALYWHRYQLRAILALFIFTALTVFSTQVSFLPRIEHYIQRPAIEFYKSLGARGQRVDVAEFKSYAHLFYGMQQPHMKSMRLNAVVTKIPSAERFLSLNPNFKEIAREGGFSFFDRLENNQK